MIDGSIQFPYQTLHIAPWQDPVLEKIGALPASLYAEYFWLPILGPTAYLFVRRVTFELSQNPDGVHYALQKLNNELGLGVRGGKHGPLWRALLRTKYFSLSMLVGPNLYIKTKLPPLTQTQIKKLPTHLKVLHSEKYFQ